MSKAELKQKFIDESTKGWDECSKKEYMAFIENDFDNWYRGYQYAQIELAKDILPIIHHVKKHPEWDSEAGMFGQYIRMQDEKLNNILK